MIENRTKMLAQTIEKLYHRGAKLNIQKIFLKTHTADIAEAIQVFDGEDLKAIFKMVVSLEDRASILSYLEESKQKELASLLDEEELAELSRLMESDDLADLLSELDDDLSTKVLNSLDSQDSEDVADLMGYPEDSAGGIMSSDYLALDKTMTVEQTISAIQAEQDSNTILFYIYVVNENEQLIGVLSLKQLLLSHKNQTLAEVMFPDVLSVNVETDQEEVAKTVERYDFLSMPVVDESNKLVGVITVDDVIDVIREEAEEDLMTMGQAGLNSGASVFEHFKARLPWLLFSYLGGMLCFFVIINFISHIIPTLGVFWILAAMIPLILTIGATSGSQAATTAITAIRMSNIDNKEVYDLLKKEMVLSLAFAALFAAITFGFGHYAFSGQQVGIFTLSISLQVIISMVIGAGTPVVISRLGVNPMIASVPIFTVLADISAMLILFGSVYGFS
ncbi:MAG: magnesium transporter [Bdellovibrionales bacterium]